MKTTKLSVAALALAAVFMVTSCSTWNNTGKGAAYGGGGGALLGAGIGALAGGGKGALIGSAIGAGVGAGAGALVGRRMDKKQAEIAASVKDAQVEKVTDINGLQAIKVTFPDGILFGFNSTTLSNSAMASLSKLAVELANEPGIDVSVYGNTDNIGSYAANQKVSQRRAEVVSNYLVGHGVPVTRIIVVKGLAYDAPVASNDTEAGRAQNRRVDIFLTANDHMVREATTASLK